MLHLGRADNCNIRMLEDLLKEKDVNGSAQGFIRILIIILPKTQIIRCYLFFLSLEDEINCFLLVTEVGERY